MGCLKAEKIELGWRVELVDKKEPDGVFRGWLNLCAMGVDGALGVHGCVGAWVCLTVFGGDCIVGLVWVRGILGVKDVVDRVDA